MRTGAVFDIDGTLADFSGRIHLAKRAKLFNTDEAWDVFHAALSHDPVKEPIAMLARALSICGHAIVVVTSRPERFRLDTTRWLAEKLVPFDLLLMRPNGDRSRSPIVKSAHVGGLTLYHHVQPLWAWDDRPDVLEAYRTLGVETFEVKR